LLKTFLIVVCLFICYGSVLGQKKYKVTYTVYSSLVGPDYGNGVLCLHGTGFSVDATLPCPAFGTTTDSYEVSTKPTSFSITADAYNSGSSCGTNTISMTTALDGSNCGYGMVSNTLCGITYKVTVKVEPILNVSGPTSDSNKNYCPSETISLTATTGYSSYVWQYRTDISPWITINTSTSNTNTVSGGDIGDNYVKNIYFRAYSDCNTVIGAVAGPYVFSPGAVSVSNFTPPTPPSCHDSTDSKIEVTSLSRTLKTGEVAEISLYNASTIFMGSTIQSASLPIVLDGADHTRFPNGIAPGSYTMLVETFFSGQQPSNCGIPFYTLVTIDNRDIVAGSASVSSPISCTGLVDGAITLTATGGNGNFEYSKNGTTYQASNVFTGLGAGPYTFIVRDGNQCVGSIPKELVDPLTVSVSNAYVTTNYDGQGSGVSCHPNSTSGPKNDGTIKIEASGGTGTFQYSLTGITYSKAYQTGSAITNLYPDSYTVSVKDQNGCISTDHPVVPLTPPAEIVYTGVSKTDLTCNGTLSGSLQVQGATGGTGALQYSLDGSTYQSSNQFANLSASTFSVTLKDTKGCTKVTTPVTLAQPSAITVSATTTKVSCLAGSDGTITATALNTVGIVQYSLDGGTTFQPANLFTDKTISSIYKVTVKDGNNCIGQSGLITIDQIPTLTGSVTQTAAIFCHGDTGVKGATLDLTPSGGTPDVGTYVYEWTKGGSTVATTQDVSGIPAGTYSVNIKDKNLCSTTLPNIVVSEPALLTSSLLVTNVSCNQVHGAALSSNGAINLMPTGGTAPYTFAWSTNSTSEDLSNLVVGTYDVIITDNNGCVANNSTALIQPNAVVSSVGSFTDVTCKGLNNGSITIAASGGTSVFSYSADGVTWQPSSVFTNLTPTDHTIITKDQNGCLSQVIKTITEPDLLVATVINIESTTCGNSNGAAEVSVTGGNGGYHYSWKNTANQSVGSGSVLSNVSGDAYTVTVVDSKNCSDSKSALVPNSDGAQIRIDSVDPTTCYDTHDGKAVITVSSGLAPYNITWSDNETGLAPTALLPGDNIVRVNDANNCVAVKLVQIPFPDVIAIATKVITPPTCSGSTDAGIALTMKGGNGSYTYAWANGQTVSSISNVPAGDYGITVKDVKNCTYASSIKIDAIPELIISVTNEQKPTCFDGSDGALTVGTTGGNGTYNYQWTDGPALAKFGNIKAGSYTVKVTDVKGCNLSSSFILNNPMPFTIIIEDKTICVGQKFKIVSDVANGTYLWTSANGFASKEQEVTLTEPGTYTLKVVNAQGCTAQDNFELKTSTDLLHADLLMISEAYQADTVVVIDLSWPLPDATTWIFPSQASVVEQNNDLGYAFLKFNKSGQYDVAIRASLGECIDMYSQTILIKEGGVTNSGGRQSTVNVIQYFEVYPNPNKGDFQIVTELSEAQPVQLMLVSTEGNKVLINQYDEGKDTYNWDVSLPDLTQGTYFLVLKAGKETKAIRMMKL